MFWHELLPELQSNEIVPKLDPGTRHALSQTCRAYRCWKVLPGPWRLYSFGREAIEYIEHADLAYVLPVLQKGIRWPQFPSRWWFPQVIASRDRADVALILEKAPSQECTRDKTWSLVAYSLIELNRLADFEALRTPERDVGQNYTRIATHVVNLDYILSRCAPNACILEHLANNFDQVDWKRLFSHAEWCRAMDEFVFPVQGNPRHLPHLWPHMSPAGRDALRLSHPTHYDTLSRINSV